MDTSVPPSKAARRRPWRRQITLVTGALLGVLLARAGYPLNVIVRDADDAATNALRFRG